MWQSVHQTDPVMLSQASSSHMTASTYNTVGCPDAKIKLADI